LNTPFDHVPNFKGWLIEHGDKDTPDRFVFFPVGSLDTNNVLEDDENILFDIR
jgi:hypothetical protein